MGQRYYILRDRVPVEVDSLLRCGEAFGIGKHVAQTVIPLEYTWGQYFRYIFGFGPMPETEILVSTVFLGINHQWGDGPPLLFETMIFGGPNDGWQARCSTWEQAESQHQEAMKIATPL